MTKTGVSVCIYSQRYPALHGMQTKTRPKGVNADLPTTLFIYVNVSVDWYACATMRRSKHEYEEIRTNRAVCLVRKEPKNHEARDIVLGASV